MSKKTHTHGNKRNFWNNHEMKKERMTSYFSTSRADGMEILTPAKMMWWSVMETAKMPGSLRPIDRMEWLADNAQAKAWLYVNLEDSQPNHIKDLAISHALCEASTKLHGAQGQGRLNFLKRNIFNRNNRRRMQQPVSATDDHTRYQKYWGTYRPGYNSYLDKFDRWRSSLVSQISSRRYGEGESHPGAKKSSNW